MPGDPREQLLLIGRKGEDGMTAVIVGRAWDREGGADTVSVIFSSFVVENPLAVMVTS